MNKIESKSWFERAEKDLKAAKDSFTSGNYDWACFQSHQAVEKALKAVYIEKSNELIKTHDLVFLAKKIHASQAIIDNCKILSVLYVATRYPDKSSEYTEEETNTFIKMALEVLTWIKKTLS